MQLGLGTGVFVAGLGVFGVAQEAQVGQGSVPADFAVVIESESRDCGNTRFDSRNGSFVWELHGSGAEALVRRATVILLPTELREWYQQVESSAFASLPGVVVPEVVSYYVTPRAEWLVRVHRDRVWKQVRWNDGIRGAVLSERERRTQSLVGALNRTLHSRDAVTGIVPLCE
jgi:hypothetical protein